MENTVESSRCEIKKHQGGVKGGGKGMVRSDGEEVTREEEEV